MRIVEVAQPHQQERHTISLARRLRGFVVNHHQLSTIAFHPSSCSRHRFLSFLCLNAFCCSSADRNLDVDVSASNPGSMRISDLCPQTYISTVPILKTRGVCMPRYTSLFRVVLSRMQEALYSDNLGSRLAPCTSQTEGLAGPFLYILLVLSRLRFSIASSS